MTVVHRLAGATPDETVLSRLLTDSLVFLADAGLIRGGDRIAEPQQIAAIVAAEESERELLTAMARRAG